MEDRPWPSWTSYLYFLRLMQAEAELLTLMRKYKVSTEDGATMIRDASVIMQARDAIKKSSNPLYGSARH